MKCILHHLTVANISIASLAFFPQSASGAIGLSLNDTAALRDAVTVNNILNHLQSLANIANGTAGGNRAATTDGYEESLAYIKDRLEDVGYVTEVQEFHFVEWQEETGSHELEQLEPNSTVYKEVVDYFTVTSVGDFLVMSNSPAGEVTASVTDVNVNLVGDRHSESGCRADDFLGFPAGNIALIQRGVCTFQQKAENAAQAGAVGVIIFNQGDAPHRKGVIGGGLGASYSGGIPVMDATFAVGEELASIIESGVDVVVKLKAVTKSVTASSKNIITETKDGRDDHVVVVGAHLDSVAAGPGINDNGSGSASILELALQMMELGIVPHNKVRFAWWGAEELGLIGASYYVSQLSPEELKKILLNLNFDMIGSPNHARFVYDGDGSDINYGAGPEGSEVIEEVFLEYFKEVGLETEPSAFNGRSDYLPFILNGIPAGGLFTGADGIMTEEQAVKFNGTQGLPYDPCYHAECDGIENVDPIALDEMSGAMAHSILSFAMADSEQML